MELLKSLFCRKLFDGNGLKKHFITLIELKIPFYTVFLPILYQHRYLAQPCFTDHDHTRSNTVIHGKAWSLSRSKIGRSTVLNRVLSSIQATVLPVTKKTVFKSINKFCLPFHYELWFQTAVTDSSAVWQIARDVPEFYWTIWYITSEYRELLIMSF